MTGSKMNKGEREDLLRLVREREHVLKLQRSADLMAEFEQQMASVYQDYSPQELAGFALRMVVERIAFRIDAMNERGLDHVSISKVFATEIVSACRRGAELLENPEPAQAGLIVGGGSDNANVSEGVTGGGECAAGDAAGEIGGDLQRPLIDDPAAPTLAVPDDYDAERDGHESYYEAIRLIRERVRNGGKEPEGGYFG